MQAEDFNEKARMKEAEITTAIIKDLKNMGCFVSKHWSGGFARRGIADVLGCPPSGRFIAIEVKAESGRVSEYQEQLAEVGVKPAQRRLFS